jgi:HSP20 family molecular chaperone IbpA
MRFYSNNLVPSKGFDYLDQFLADFLAYPTRVYKGNNALNTDVYENDNAYVLAVELPGFKKEDVSVEFDSGYLIINAKKEPDNEDLKYLCRESFSGTIKRSYYLGEKFSADDVTASLSDGILKIVINKPKQEKQSSRLISIN